MQQPGHRAITVVDLRSHSGLHSACSGPAQVVHSGLWWWCCCCSAPLLPLFAASTAAHQPAGCSGPSSVERAARSCRGWDCEEPEGPEHRERKPPEHCQTATHGSGRGEPWLRGEVPWIEARDRGRNSPLSDTRRKELATVRRAMEEDKARLLWVSWGRVRPWRR
jgi:hypothetical protein